MLNVMKQNLHVEDVFDLAEPVNIRHQYKRESLYQARTVRLSQTIE